MRKIFFDEEMLDILAEKVAQKLATKYYRNGLFSDRENNERRHERDTYNYDGGCGGGAVYNGSC